MPTRIEARHPVWLAALLVLLAIGARQIIAAGGEDAASFPLISLSTPLGEMSAALADRPARRGMGYRNISSDRAPSAIYFLYPEPRQVTFDMGSVRFPVRAYWVGPDHCIKGWVDMTPGASDGFRSPGKVIAVLEIPAFNRPGRKLDRGDCVRPE